MTDFVEKASGKIEKLSNEQLNRILKSVREENEVFDSIIQSIPFGIVITDREWGMTKINKAAKRFIPFTHLQQSKSEPVWNQIADDEISRFILLCAQSQNTNTSREFSTVSSDNKTRFLLVSLIPLVQDSKATGTVISIEDMTAQRQEEILLHRMESLSSLTNLAASVAHEIKNPLGAISIHIQLLQKAIKKSREKDGKLPEEKFVEKYLDVVTEEIDSLNKIVMDFLFAVRPLKVNLTLSDADSIVEKTLAFFTPELETNRIKVSLDLCRLSSRVMIDEKLFREVIVNIVQNAKSALIASGKEDLKLAVNSLEKGEYYILTIADNGIGMSKETCDRIFEPYFTTKADGTGLGLTTVYKIIKEFRGDISVNSEIDKGTLFTIQIPLLQKRTMLLSDSREEK